MDEADTDTPPVAREPTPRVSASRGGLLRMFTNATYDAEKGGSTPREQLSSSSAVLKLSELPPYVADALRSLDVDGDGTINVGELHVGAEAADRNLKKSQFFRKLFVILFGLWLVRALVMDISPLPSRANACGIHFVPAGAAGLHLRRRVRHRQLRKGAARRACKRACSC
jgi:hypothetical protein